MSKNVPPHGRQRRLPLSAELRHSAPVAVDFKDLVLGQEKKRVNLYAFGRGAASSPSVTSTSILELE